MSDLNPSEQVLQHPPTRMVARSLVEAARILIDRVFAMGFGDEAATLIKHIHRKSRETGE